MIFLWYETHENIKYIKQFALLEKESEKAEAEFSRSIESEQSQFVQEYLRPFSLAVNEVAGIDAIKDEKKIDDYIKSLIKYATEAERADAFSNQIRNPAHKIIYQNLSDKFNELLSNKTQFLDESEALYKDALQKYQM